MCCFTEASVSTNHSQVAYLIDHAPTHSGEMTAIYQCLLNLPLTMHLKFIIFSDSQSSLRKLQDTHKILTDAIIFQAIYTFHHLQHAAKITFIWIPNHCGIVGHNILDAAARALTHSTISLISPLDLRKHICCLLTNSWNTEWTRSHGKFPRIGEKTE